MIFSLLSCHFSLLVFVSKNFHLSRATTSSQKMGEEVVEAVSGEYQEGGEDCKNVHGIVRQHSCKRTLSWACLLFVDVLTKVPGVDFQVLCSFGSCHVLHQPHGIVHRPGASVFH